MPPIATEQRAQEQRQIVRMLEEIRTTPTGAQAVHELRRRRYQVRFGQPLGGGAFTYPWKVITLRRGYPYETTLGMLIHELGHVLFISDHTHLWSGSVEQEYQASRFWAQVSRELNRLPDRLEEKWLGPEPDISSLYDEIRRPSLWHRMALPTSQPRGIGDKIWALWQAIVSLTWLLSISGSRLLRRKRHANSNREPGPG
jgi:hypothetical protein